MLENHILLLFKVCLYNFRKQEKVTLRIFRIITKVKDIGKESAANDDKKIMLYKKMAKYYESMSHGWGYSFCVLYFCLY